MNTPHVTASPLPDNWWTIECDHCPDLLHMIKDTQIEGEIPPIVGKAAAEHLLYHGVRVPVAYQRFIRNTDA